ncbi:hypothetical protein NDU88_006349 [Pleurodeles waltl]|uniref:Secreted protein n=1 Tax=Pleurodeles waltl TaxID=8319 RepID=A0AAV7QIG7_PLEWA|nr:hypothetical protein NDU88_006349 [Pleurodeles waltl]
MLVRRRACISVAIYIRVSAFASVSRSVKARGFVRERTVPLCAPLRAPVCKSAVGLRSVEQQNIKWQLQVFKYLGVKINRDDRDIRAANLGKSLQALKGCVDASCNCSQWLG